MITNGFPRFAAIAAKIKFPFYVKWLFSLLTVVLLVAAAAPSTQESPDEQYIRIMTIIDKADVARMNSQTNLAKAKYEEAQSALVYFKRINPLWNTRMVTYRLNEVTERIDAYTKPPPVVTVRTPTPAPKKPEPKIEAIEAESENPKANESTIKLIDAGAEPRKALRFHPKAGDKQNVTIALKIDMEMPNGPTPRGGKGGGGGIPKLPAITIPAEVTIQSVAANGDISFSGVVGEGSIAQEPGMMPQMVQGMKMAFGTIKGFAILGTISSRGISKHFDFKAPAGAPPELSQALEKAKANVAGIEVPILPVPVEPVGMGAKWEVKKVSDFQGISADQSVTYELISVDGDHVKTGSTLVQTAGQQEIRGPMTGGAPLTLLHMDVNANGTSALDLSKLVPVESKMVMHMEMNAEVAAGNQRQPIAMKLDLNLNIDSK